MTEVKKSRVVKKGRIKKIISEWDFFWKDKQEFLAEPLTWHDSIPEVLHIAISLQNNEPEKILEGLKFIKNELKNTYNIDWKGNLSNLFQLIYESPKIFELIKKTVLYESINALVVTYHKLFNYEVPSGNLFAHTIVYRAYFDIKERKKDISILCKYILCKLLGNEEKDYFNLLKANTREEILEFSFASSVTPNWICISHAHDIVNYNFSNSIWHYNINNLPFIVEPDETVSKRESQEFKLNKMNLAKEKLDNYFIEFKKIDLRNYLNRYVAEVFMGFIARIHYLAVKIVEQEERHEGEIAEATLRILFESRLKFLWMNYSQDLEVIKQFREYKVGREKLFMDFLQSKIDENPDLGNQMDKINKTFEAYKLNEGVDENNVAIEKGDAFGVTVQKMAEDLGQDEENSYFFVYKRTSDIIHGNWRIIEKYHLDKSLNPAQHSQLRYATTKNTYAGNLPSLLGITLATSSLIKFFEFNEPILKENKKLYNSLKRFHTTLNKKYLKMFSS